MVPPYHGMLLGNKKEKYLLHTITWMNLQIIMLSEESPKLHSVLFYISQSWNEKMIEMERRLTFGRCWRWWGEVGTVEGSGWGYKRAARAFLTVMEAFCPDSINVHVPGCHISTMVWQDIALREIRYTVHEICMISYNCMWFYNEFKVKV